jgi:hypothetical protein
LRWGRGAAIFPGSRCGAHRRRRSSSVASDLSLLTIFSASEPLNSFRGGKHVCGRLSDEAWIDVVQDGAPLKPVNFSGQKDCRNLIEA